MRTVPLKRLIDPRRPLTYGIVQAGEDVPGGVPYIRPVDMDGHRGVNPKTLRTTAPEIAQAYSRSSLRPGDLVVSIGPSFGKTMTVPPELRGANLTQGTARVAVAEGTERNFVRWVLQSQLATGYWESAVGGATFRALNLGPLAATPIPVQHVRYQRTVADFLDRETAQIDLLIEKQNALIDRLRERQVAMATAVIEAQDPAASDAPRLRHHVKNVRQGWSPQCYNWPAPEGRWAVLRAGCTNRGVFRPDDNKELPKDVVPRRDTVVRDGEMIVGRANTRDLLGGAAVVRGHHPHLMLSDKLYAFRLAPQVVPEYVASVLGTSRYRELIKLEAQGTSPSMQNISLADLLNLPMRLPSLQEQRKVVHLLQAETTKVGELVRKAQRFVELARERRSALITAAVTGQIDVVEAGVA